MGTLTPATSLVLARRPDVKILDSGRTASSQLFNTFPATAREALNGMEWATQGDQLETPGTGGAQATMPITPAVPSAAPPSTPLGAGTGEQCQACGAYVAADQRYCLHCGQRRGDPRLPFMDASAFMETSMQRRRPPAPPPPAPPRKSRMSPNASLIAGVGTLLLAMGIGVLIGRSGDNSGSTAATPPVQVVKVGGGTATGAGAKTASTGATGSKSTKVKVPASKDANKQAASSVLKPKVKLPPAAVKLGDPGHGPGYKNGKFTGQFFGP